MTRNTVKFKSSSLFQGCCVSPSSLLWMIITLFIFFIIFVTLGLLAIWLLCAYYRRKSRKQIENELQRRRDDKNQLKLDMFRKKQLDLQMLAAVKNAGIDSKELLSFYSPERRNSRVSLMPNIQPSKSEQYPRLLDSSPHGNLSLPQPVSSIAPNAAKDKIAKEIKDLQLLPALTARTPSQKTKKSEKLATKKDSHETDEIEMKDDEEPQVQQHEIDVSVSNENRLRKKCKKKRKPKPKEERSTRKSADQKYLQTTSTPTPGRYHHQIQPDNVYEWINRIACSTSPIPYYSPNKRVLLVPEPTTENSDVKNDEKNGESNASLDATGTNTSEKLANSPSYSNPELETDVEISPDTKEESTPITPTPISASINAPPNDHSYWGQKSKQKKYLEIDENPKEKILWNPPDKRAEARLNRSLENPWLYTMPAVHSRMSSSREE